MSVQTRLLVVDDDHEIRELTARYLASQGFAVATAESCRTCEEAVAADAPALVVLDVMLPDGSGLDVCRRLKDRHPSVAVILLTALKEDIDRIVGLEIGADDYLVKPFNPRELAARVRAVLRRVAPADAAPKPQPGALFRFDGHEVDLRRRHVRDPQGRELDLTGTEFDLLHIFLERPGRLLRRDELLELLHGRRSVDPFDRTIDVTVSRLRRKLGDNGVFRLFKTVRNGGYQFAAEVHRERRE